MLLVGNYLSNLVVRVFKEVEGRVVQVIIISSKKVTIGAIEWTPLAEPIYALIESLLAPVVIIEFFLFICQVWDLEALSKILKQNKE